MCTNIDINNSIKQISTFLAKIWDKYDCKVMKDAIEIMMNNNRMKFGDLIYHQIRGLATGGPSLMKFGTHCHNDCGLAAANTLASVRARVGLAQSTVNDIGERIGNADLCSIILSLALHCNVSKMKNENNCRL
jgi:isopropylmalate/homocitrate/citramalate synthase